ncbi:MAG: peptidoglycan bridge formation glycyltransferase FemA/FemB family protein [Eubacteriales bacterium]|nr:peptidoglycan bridge formation glycyltransferase FemA/FemB family protein [Eubacteriales bacterium]
MTSDFRKISAAEYREYFGKSLEPSLLQAPAWPDLKEAWEPLRFASFRAGEAVALAQVLIRRFPFAQEFAYLAMGPTLLEAECTAVEADRLACLEGIIDYLKRQRKNCFLFKVQTPRLRKCFSLDEAEPEADLAADKAYLEAMSKLGFRHRGLSRDLESTTQPRYQALIYKTDWEAGKHARLRYNLRQLERRSVTVFKSSVAELDSFMHCINCTEERQEIALRDRQYFERLIELFGQEAELFLARIDAQTGRKKASRELAELEAELAACPEHAKKKRNQIEERLNSARKISEFFAEISDVDTADIAAALLVNLGRVSELPYAGNDERFFTVPASWGIYNAIIESSFAHGAWRINLGGLDGNFADGLTRFKAHFNPRIEENYGEFDLPLKAVRAKLFQKLLEYRKRHI